MYDQPSPFTEKPPHRQNTYSVLVGSCPRALLCTFSFTLSSHSTRFSVIPTDSFSFSSTFFCALSLSLSCSLYTHSKCVATLSTKFVWPSSANQPCLAFFGHSLCFSSSLLVFRIRIVFIVIRICFFRRRRRRRRSRPRPNTMAPLSTGTLGKIEPVSIDEQQRHGKSTSDQLLSKEELEEQKYAERFNYFKVTNPTNEKNVRYIFVDEERYGLVWPNVIMFTLLHAYYAYGMFELLIVLPYRTWFFGQCLLNFKFDSLEFFHCPSLSSTLLSSS